MSTGSATPIWPEFALPHDSFGVRSQHLRLPAHLIPSINQVPNVVPCRWLGCTHVKKDSKIRAQIGTP
jgi:hypothetical protein